MESEKLIEEVRKYPVLYNQSDAEYKERVWKIISETLKIPGGMEECKKKWGSIRDQFRWTLQKRKTKSGQAAAKKTKYKYEEVLEFLLPHIADRETLSNIPSLEDKRDSELDPRMEEPDSELIQKVSLIAKTRFRSILVPVFRLHSALSSQATHGKKHLFTRPVNVKRKGLKGSNFENPAHESPSSQLMSYILAEKEAEKTRINTPPQHPVDIFLASLAPTLKSLDPVLLNQAKTTIFSAVQDLKQLAKNRSHQQILTNPLRLDMANLSSCLTAPGSSSTSHSSSTSESPHYNSFTLFLEL